MAKWFTIKGAGSNPSEKMRFKDLIYEADYTDDELDKIFDLGEEESVVFPETEEVAELTVMRLKDE